MLTSWDLSDGRALYLSGIRPKEYEGSDCIYDTDEDIALTLVDTEHGTKLWTREWAFTPDQLSLQTTLRVLGTSGRAVIAYGNPGYGPHEVLDLTTGQTVAPFDPGIPRFSLARDATTVGDASGDLLIVDAQRGADGSESSTPSLRRIDPRDPAHPKWSTTVNGNLVDFLPAVDSATAIPISYGRGYGQDSRSFTAMVDSVSGAVTESSALNNVDTFGSVYVTQTGGLDGAPRELTGFDATGAKVWTTAAPPGTIAQAVATAGAQAAGSRGGTDSGLFVVTGADTVTLYDQATGTARWSATATGCGPQTTGGIGTVQDARDAIVTSVGGQTCSFDRTTGAPVANTRGDGFTQLLGTRNSYTYDPQDASAGIATDMATGNVLWTRPRRLWESWRFSGGYLVTNDGNHLESIG